MIIETFLSTYFLFFKRMKKKKTTSITKNRTLLALQKKSQT